MNAIRAYIETALRLADTYMQSIETAKHHTKLLHIISVLTALLSDIDND